MIRELVSTYVDIERRYAEFAISDASEIPLIPLDELVNGSSIEYVDSNNKLKILKLRESKDGTTKEFIPIN